MKNKIFVISGAAGVGQGTIIKELLKKPELNLKWLKGYTTRPERPSDKIEQKYFFVNEKRFKELIKTGEIFEFTYFNNENWYGSSKSEIEKAISHGLNVIRDVDPIEGGKAYRKLYPKSVFIFISADLKDIRQRMINRGQNTLEQIEKRINFAEKELLHAKYYDYIVDNIEGHPEIAIEEVTNIIKRELND